MMIFDLDVHIDRFSQKKDLRKSAAWVLWFEHKFMTHYI